VGSECSFLVSAEKLKDAVNSFPKGKGTVSFKEKEGVLLVSCSGVSAELEIKEDELERVNIPYLENAIAKVTADSLCQAIKQVTFAVASNTSFSRPELTGVLMRFQENRVVLVAADGARLAASEISLEEATIADVSVIVPAYALNDLAHIIKGKNNVEITVAPEGGYILFHTKSVDFVSWLIDGKFPDYERIIPTEWSTRVVLDTKKLLLLTKEILKTDPVSDQVVLNFYEQRGNAITVGYRIGDVKGGEDLDVEQPKKCWHFELCEKSGLDVEISLNVKFLSETLKVIGTSFVAMEILGTNKPIVIRPVGESQHWQMIMPMHLPKWIAKEKK
jgi:DNA polymerase-3 subunit beta